MNGGVNVDYVYSGLALSNAGDEVEIRAGPLVIDRVAYTSSTGFTISAGRSLALDPETLDFSSNDDGSNWCLSTTVLASGDTGTPGTVNDSCQPPIDRDPPVITHTPINDGQPAGVAVRVLAEVTDQLPLDSVDLFYRAAGAAAYERVAMVDIGAGRYQADISADAVAVGTLEYYLRAIDQAMPANSALLPTEGPSSPLTFTVSPNDLAGPAILYVPPLDANQNRSFEIVADINDPSGINAAQATWRVDGGPWTTVDLTEEMMGRYRGQIDAADLTGDLLEYYLTASDAVGNTSQLPTDGENAPWQVTLLPVDDVSPTIAHEASTEAVLASTAVELMATVSDDSGVAAVQLYVLEADTGAFIAVPAVAGTGGAFDATVPAGLVTAPRLEYYWEAEDSSDNQNIARLPDMAPEQRFTVDVDGTDEQGPMIDHQPLAEPVDVGTDVSLAATITDPSGLDAVQLRYWVGNADPRTLPMTGDADVYAVEIPAEQVTDRIEYVIEATDAAGNTSIAPDATGERYAVDVNEPTAPPPSGPGGDGGCACHTPSTRTSPWLALLLLGVVPLRRRWRARGNSGPDRRA